MHGAALDFRRPSYIRIQTVTGIATPGNPGDTSPRKNMLHGCRTCRLGPAVLTTSLKENAMQSKASFTKRAILAGLLAGSGILAMSAYAVAGRDPADKPGCEARLGQKDFGKWEARRAERMAELKEKLKLAPGQEAAWSKFVEAGQVDHRQGADRKAMRDEFEKLNTPQRLDMMLAMSDMRRAGMVERAEATKAFYAQLNPDQQRVFDAEAMPGRHRDHRH